MYVKLLEEVTKELSGEQTHSQKEIKLELVLDAYISEQYIASQEERIVFYNKISQISNKSDYNQVINELKSTNGELPVEVENLCKIALLKNLASEFNVYKIKINSKDCALYFYKSADIIDKRLSKIGKFYDTCLKFEELPILKLNAQGKVIDKVNLLTEMLLNALDCKKD